MFANVKFQGTLRYKKLVPEAKIDIPVFRGDAGYDVHCTEDVTIKAHSSEMVHTGIVLEIPEDYFALVRTRSGYGAKNTMQLHHGLIDSGYRGEITVRVYNHGNEEYQIKKGDKVCQIVLFPRIVIPLKEEKELKPSERGLKGLGSTGK